MIKLSLCIATYRRFDFLSKNLPKYLDNKYIDEIIIVDEDGHDYELLETYFENSKIKLYQNQEKLGPFLNKERAVSLASNDWVCLMDSDNFAPIEYFEAWVAYSEKNGLNDKIIYSPSKTLPEGNFDFTFMVGKTVNFETVKSLWHLHNFGAYINLGNYIINKNEFLNVSNEKEYEKNCLIDVQYRNTFMILNNCCIIAVPKMEYFHERHNGYYLQNCDIPENKIIVEKINKLLNN